MAVLKMETVGPICLTIAVVGAVSAGLALAIRCNFQYQAYESKFYSDCAAARGNVFGKDSDYVCITVKDGQIKAVWQ